MWSETDRVMLKAESLIPTKSSEGDITIFVMRIQEKKNITRLYPHRSSGFDIIRARDRKHAW